MRANFWAKTLCLGLLATSCTTAKFEPRPVGTSFVQPQETSRFLAQAKAQFRLGNIALALENFRKAARQSPESIDALNGIAASYDRMGRFDLSRRYYEEALALGPGDPKTRHNFAVSLRMQGLHDQALAFEQEERAFDGAEQSLAHAEAKPTFVSPKGQSVTVSLPPAPPLKLATAQVDDSRSASSVEAPEMIVSDTKSAPPTVRRPATSPQKQRAHAASIRIMNAVGRRGQARRMQTYLAGKGWRNSAIGDADRQRSQSIILYPAGSSAAAQALARQLPFRTTVSASPLASRVVLLLGGNSTAFDDRLGAGKKG
ncbi:MAG TPA: LytR C-terminal domain-containing protein [Allosphingosinicella sp.]|uniref:LytR C-terminal domain-containing protein n=1 Tax=Allosphingosinicella sp. TaxID=2823234 RepID=UPI002ED974F9